MQPRLLRDQEPLVHAQQRTDWRDHVQFTAIVVGAAIDGHEVPMRVALARLMANQDTIADHTASQARLNGKAFIRDELARTLHEHISLALAVVNNLVRVLRPASALDANYDLKFMYYEKVTRWMREKMQAYMPIFEAARRGSTPSDADREAFKRATENVRLNAVSFLADRGQQLQWTIGSRDLNTIVHEAETAVESIEHWYRNALEVAEVLSSLTRGDKPASLKYFAGLMYTHIEQLTAEALNYYFRRYPAWIAAIDESNRHIELLADVVAQAVIN